jgi:hypothetical protein
MAEKMRKKPAERRGSRRRTKVDPGALPEWGTRRRGAGRRETDDFWAKVRDLPSKRR